MISRRGMTAMKKIRKYLEVDSVEDEDDSDDGNGDGKVRVNKLVSILHLLKGS